MKVITREWLNRAADDLVTAQVLLTQADLTNIVAFHAQQAVEKTLKAVLEELDLGAVRTHSLVRLYEVVCPHCPVIDDLDMLDRLDTVYIEARYPSEMGLLPYGKPTMEQATTFYAFAQLVFQHIQDRLDDLQTPDDEN